MDAGREDALARADGVALLVERSSEPSGERRASSSRTALVPTSMAARTGLRTGRGSRLYRTGVQWRSDAASPSGLAGIERLHVVVTELDIPVTRPVRPPRPQSVPWKLTDPRLFINRELSWLAFNERVLRRQGRALPLYERLKFLAIVVVEPRRVLHGARWRASKQQLAGGVAETAADGMLPAEQLAAISERAHAHGRRAVSASGGTSCCRCWPRTAWRSLTRGRADAPSRSAAAKAYFTLVGVPGADAAGGRSRPPVPAPAQQVAQHRGARCAREGRRRASGSVPARLARGGAGAERARRARAAAAAAGHGAACSCSRSSSRCARRRAVPRLRRGADGVLPRDPQLGPERRRGGVRRSALHDPGGAAPARPRRRGAARAGRGATRGARDMRSTAALEARRRRTSTASQGAAAARRT